MTDLTTMTVEELIEFRRSIDAEIEGRLAKKREEAKRQIVEIARENFISSGDLEKMIASTKVYRNPDNPWETWGGKGRKPKWVKKALDAGKKLDDLLLPPTN